MRNMQLTCALITAVLATAATAQTRPSGPSTRSAATAPATQPTAKAPTTGPATRPTTRAATTAPATRPAVKIARPQTDTVRFNYHDVPYIDVVKRFAQMAKKPLIGDVAIEGNLRHFRTPAIGMRHVVRIRNFQNTQFPVIITEQRDPQTVPQAAGTCVALRFLTH